MFKNRVLLRLLDSRHKVALIRRQVHKFEEVVRNVVLLEILQGIANCKRGVFGNIAQFQSVLKEIANRVLVSQVESKQKGILNL